MRTLLQLLQLLLLGLVGCADSEKGATGPAREESEAQDSAAGAGGPDSGGGAGAGDDGGGEGGDGGEPESCPERPVLATLEAAVDPDLAVSCAGRRCTVTVDTDEGRMAHLDAGERLYSRVPRSSESILLIDTVEARRLDLGTFLVDLSVHDCGAWLLTTEALLLLDDELQVRVEVPLPERELHPEHVWGTADRALVTLGDETLQWTDEAGWEVFSADTGHGKLTLITESWLIEAAGTHVYGWTVENGVPGAATRTELYASDDNMDWARTCADSETHWVTSSTGASARCTPGGPCAVTFGAYVQGRAGVCEDGRLGTLEGGAIRWFRGPDDHEDEPVEGIFSLSGSAARTWVFVHAR